MPADAAPPCTGHVPRAETRESLMFLTCLASTASSASLTQSQYRLSLYWLVIVPVRDRHAPSIFSGGEVLVSALRELLSSRQPVLLEERVRPPSECGQVRSSPKNPAAVRNVTPSPRRWLGC